MTASRQLLVGAALGLSVALAAVTDAAAATTAATAATAVTDAAATNDVKETQIAPGTYEVELPANMKALAPVSKLTLVLFQFFGLGLCGIDRCWLGNCCCGVAKGLTIGGLGFWALIDCIVIYANAVQMEPYLDTVGLQAVFQADTMESAKILAWVGIVLSILNQLLQIYKLATHKKEKGEALSESDE